MLLNELARTSGTSTASIKYYRRQGLLPPGRRLTATRFDYGREHLERLALIRALRELAHAPIEDIRTLTTVIDEGRPLVKALEIAQAIATGLPARLHEEPPPEGEDPRVAELVEAMGWADVGSGPRVALDRLLGTMGAEGVASDLPTLLRYARPLEEIAREDLAGIRSAPQSTPGATADGHSPSTDAIVRQALIGSLAFTQLTVVLRALAHASVSLEVGAEEGQTGPHGAHH
ncbi:MerR family transcriptional regulator [Brachybacterium kimchii]|uniref:MerR family transcriptional regulator n=1 Tax=Brachybacterium kimchii TaxID=2942909 RepID=A0ABY4N5P3_9MICO|nr:MerR family transcriptional regulator [Brachybacterium kimchii]UQN29107.1 MerR family transcriptional regulator [Brachybacterium kimchii]